MSWNRDSKGQHTGNSTDVEALVVHKRPLDFDLLRGYDAIKALGGVLIKRIEWILMWSLMAFVILLVSITELDGGVFPFMTQFEKRELVEGLHFWPEHSTHMKCDTTATKSNVQSRRPCTDIM